MTKVTAEVEVERLEPGRLLFMYTEIGTAEAENGRVFTILRSPAGAKFAFEEKVDGEAVVHTVDFTPAFGAVFTHLTADPDPTG